jgi:ribosomal protein L24E
LKITHSQEIPLREDEYCLQNGFHPGEGTIFVIDDGSAATMLWADEY